MFFIRGIKQAKKGRRRAKKEKNENMPVDETEGMDLDDDVEDMEEEMDSLQMAAPVAQGLILLIFKIIF